MLINRIVILIFLFLTLAAFSFGQVNHKVSFSQSELQIESKRMSNGEVFDRLNFPDLRKTDELGKPELPVKYLRLLLPPEAPFRQLRVLEFADDKSAFPE